MKKKSLSEQDICTKFSTPALEHTGRDRITEKDGRNHDPFVLICHMIFEMPPLIRRELVGYVKKSSYFTKTGNRPSGNSNPNFVRR